MNTLLINMALSEEVPKPSYDTAENIQSTLLENNVQNSAPKKKFYNTVFATKIRNRKKEEKLKNLDLKDIVKSCKPLSIDLTRITTNSVPKLLSTVENRNRKRKRFQWKLGYTKKRKRLRDKNKNMDKNNKTHSEKSNMSNMKNLDIQNLKTGQKMAINKIDEQNKSKSPLKKADVQKSKSSKHNTSVKSSVKSNYETSSDNEHIIDECSCRRTEPFIGKLHTKEARIAYIEKFLKEQSDLLIQNNEVDVTNKKDTNDRIEKNKDLNSEQPVTKVNENSKNNENLKNNNQLNKISKEDENSDINKSNTSIKNNKNCESSTKDTNKEVTELKKISKNVAKTKEDVKVEEKISCKRTEPFVGKIPRKPPPGVSERPIVIDSSSDKNANSDSASEDINTSPKIVEKVDSLGNKNTKPEPCKIVRRNSNSSLKEINKTSDSVKSTEVMEIPSLNEKNVNATDVNTELNTSSSNEKLKSKTIPKIQESITLDLPSENVNVKSDSSLNSSLKPDEKTQCAISDPTKQQLTTIPMPSTNSEEDICSCQRIIPYSGKNYCSRTLPFVQVIDKTKIATKLAISTGIVSKIDPANNEIMVRLSTSEADKLIEDLRNNQNTNIPRNQENEINNSNANISSSLDNNNSDVQIRNGEWKFKRKRNKINSEEEEHIDNEQVLKKLKSSADYTSPINKELTANTTSSTICSNFSSNSITHVHHEDLSNSEALSHNVKPNAYILLTRLEYASDPLVTQYLKKTDSCYKIKKELHSPIKNKIDSNETNTSVLDSEKHVSHANEEEQTAKDNLSTVNASNATLETNSNDVRIKVTIPQDPADNEEEAGSKSNESVIKPRVRTRRRSTLSSESPNSVYSKRRKRPVNYLEEFSDSETEASSAFTRSLRNRPQSRGPSLRERNKSITYSHDEQDEDDMEVEEFSRIGRKRTVRALSSGSEDSSHNKSDIEGPCLRTRAKSRAAETIEASLEKDSSESTNVAKETPKIQTRDETSNKEKSNEQNYEEKNEQNKVVEELSHDCARLRPVSRGPGTDVLKSPTGLNTCSNEALRNILQTPTQSLQIVNERMLSTPKSTSGRKSRAAKTDETFGTPKRIPGTPVHSEGDVSLNNNKSTTPKSIKHVKNNLLDKLASPKTTSELSTTDTLTTETETLMDLKVQLIKLEAICSSFQDYSASEIELLTKKYIDLLMNSNFNCDTWKNPINYHRPNAVIVSHIEEIDNSDCISDTEYQDNEYPTLIDPEEPIDTSNFVSVIIEEDGVVTDNSILTASSNNPNFTTLTPLGSAVTTLSERRESLEPRNQFGAVNISDALNLPSNASNDNEQIIITTRDENVRNLEVQKISQQNKTHNEAIQDEVISKPRTLLVNGTTMYVCTFCNKIFVTVDLHAWHVRVFHFNADKTASNTSTATTTKSTVKQTREIVGPASAKNLSKNKGKKYSDNLRCTICSVMFESKELLFEHIMTHNEQELQEAYKLAKAKVRRSKSTLHNLPEDTDKEQEGADGNKEKTNKEKRKKSTDSSTLSNRSSIDVDEATIQPITLAEQQQVIDLGSNENCIIVENTPSSTAQERLITICACHAHETTSQDLQIEMILFCKTCNVIFRRRDCFEVHYRSSPECRQKRTNNEVTKVPKLFCSGCPCLLDSLMEMRTHLEWHAKKNCQGTVTFICNICKVAFFGVGGIFYSHWFNHTKSPNFVASRYSFPKLSVVSVIEDSNVAMTTSKSQEGFFYIAEHVCRQCRLPFSSEPELQKHKLSPCQSQQPVIPRLEVPETNRLQMIKLMCDLCKKYYVSKENFDRHCSERNHLKTPITKFSRLAITADEQAFVCSLCRAVSKSLDEMKEHWKRVHSPIMELYTCKTCNITPSSDASNYTYDKFERHCRLAHKSEVITCLVYYVTAPYVCNLCKFGFETEKSMKEHQVIHQKTNTQTTAPKRTNPIPLAPGPLPVNSSCRVPDVQTTTLWVADQQIQPDGGRQVHPVYVQYPSNVNGSVSTQINVPANIGVVNTPNQQISTSNVNPSQVPVSASSVIQHNNNLNSVNTVLRQMLAHKSIEQQQQQNQQVAANPPVEMITIDSRSNSPMDTTIVAISNVATTTSNTTVTTNANTTDAVPTSRKSYMTMVNPDFESILGSKNNTQAEGNTNSNIQNNLNADDSSMSSSNTDALVPQPFEVVLVTDDLSDNSNNDTPNNNDKNTALNKKADNNDSAPNQQSAAESVSTKSPFLRVRSIAELQRISIHLCQTCGLSFDTPHAFELHTKQHENASPHATNEIGRATPVQMISPMVAPPHKESRRNSPSTLVTQMRQKMNLLTGQTSSNTEVNARVKPSINSNQTLFQRQQYQQQQQQLLHQQSNQQQQLQHQQQSQQSYWFTPCNGTNGTNSPTVYNTNCQPQSQQNFLQRPSNQSNIVNPGYTTTPQRPPPPYPGSSNLLTSGRPGAIQLPERNTAGSSVPTQKRPSGAATRIPQQSLSNYQEITDNRQPVSPLWDFMMGVRVPYNVANNSMAGRIHPQQQQYQQNKSCNRHPNDMNYTNNLGNNLNYQPQQQQLQQIQQPVQKVIYKCKYANTCTFRSENLNAVRAHEKSHIPPIQQSVTTSTNQINQIHQQQQQLQQLQQPQQQLQQQLHQQQRLPSAKHVSVCQMPERPPRYALSNNKQQNPNSFICRICELQCSTKNELITHVSTTHSSVSNELCCYICDYCSTPEIFESIEDLRKHMDSNHNHFCELCNKRYPSNTDLQLHMEAHTRRT